MQAADELVSRQMRRRELERYLQEHDPREEPASQAPGSVITISRERGSGGTAVGKMVAETLGWDFYDRELINHVADHMGAPVEHIESHDERSPGFLQNLLLQLLEGRRPTETQYLRALIRILRSIRARGRAVIMGRGAHLVLPDALRVRIVAPTQIRIERLAAEENLTLAEARQQLLAADRDRAQFVSAYFGVDPADPCYFDLTINTAGVSLSQAAHLIVCALRDRQESAE